MLSNRQIRSQYLCVILLLVGIGGSLVIRASHAQDGGADGNDTPHAKHVRLLAGNTDQACIGYLKFLRTRKDDPSVCEALRQQSPFVPKELPWHSVDYRSHTGNIERIYETFEQVQPFSFAQREVGPRYPGLRSKQNRNFYEGIGNIFWSKFGDLILHEYEVGRLTVESTEIELGSDAEKYELFRIPLWEPMSESQLAPRQLTCGSHSDVPSYYIFADKKDAPELASYFFNAGRGSDIVNFDGVLYYGFFDEGPSGEGSIILRRLIDAHKPDMPTERACTIVVGR